MLNVGNRESRVSKPEEDRTVEMEKGKDTNRFVKVALVLAIVLVTFIGYSYYEYEYVENASGNIWYDYLSSYILPIWTVQRSDVVCNYRELEWKRFYRKLNNILADEWRLMHLRHWVNTNYNILGFRYFQRPGSNVSITSHYFINTQQITAVNVFIDYQGTTSGYLVPD